MNHGHEVRPQSRKASGARGTELDWGLTPTPVLSLALVLSVFAHTGLAQSPYPTKPPEQPPTTATPSTPPTSSTTGPPRLPPFAGTLVNFDRRGERVVACVDRSAVHGRSGAPSPPPATPKLPPSYRIWLIEREVMQELMTTGGLCDPVLSPDGKTFVAAGPRGVFAFTEPNYEARVLMMGALPASSGAPPGPTSQGAAGSSVPPAPTGAIVEREATGGDSASTRFSQVSFSPSGRRVAFLMTSKGVTSVKVVEAKEGTSVFSREQPAKLVQWGTDDRSLVIDGVRTSLP